MEKPDVKESVPICHTVLLDMLGLSPTSGRTGADLRTAVGDFLAHAEYLLTYDLTGPPLTEIFELARQAGATFAVLEHVRKTAAGLTANLLGAVLIRDSLIGLALATEAQVLANMVFVSRDDVDAMKRSLNDAFTPMEEVTADKMDQDGYVGIVSLHAAAIAHLTETARPLPRMLNFTFHSPSLPTLIAAYRLYADASRADELRAENHVVHPLFMRPAGRALSN